MAPAGSLATGDMRRYSVRAQFLLGSGDNGYYRVALERSTTLTFETEVRNALRTLVPGAVLESAEAIVSPEQLTSSFIRGTRGQWPVELRAVYRSPVRLTRDEWVDLLGGAFRWAWRAEWATAWDADKPRDPVESFLGGQGSGAHFVAAANDPERSRRVLTYVGGSMLERPLAAPPAPSTPPPPPAPTQAGRAGGRSPDPVPVDPTPDEPRPESGETLTSFPPAYSLTNPPPPIPIPAGFVVLGGVAALAAAAALGVWLWPRPDESAPKPSPR